VMAVCDGRGDGRVWDGYVCDRCVCDRCVCDGCVMDVCDTNKGRIFLPH
jgi:hypothetical protein